jgi:chromosome segregation ATPase
MLRRDTDKWLADLARVRVIEKAREVVRKPIEEAREAEFPHSDIESALAVTPKELEQIECERVRELWGEASTLQYDVERLEEEFEQAQEDYERVRGELLEAMEEIGLEAEH